MLGFTDLELPVVELYRRISLCPGHTEIVTHVQFPALEDVPICSSNLSRPRADDGEKATSLELRLDKWVDLGILLAFLEDTFDVVGLFLVGCLLGHLGAAEDGLSVLKNGLDLRGYKA